jgi:signal transduction histidine kinase
VSEAPEELEPALPEFASERIRYLSSGKFEMTIRRRLIFSFSAILLLLGLNLIIYFWSDLRRQSAFEEVRRAIAIENHLSSVERQLNDFHKQVTLLSPIGIDPARDRASTEEIAQFNSGLDALGHEIEQIRTQNGNANAASFEEFASGVQQLSTSWRIFFTSLGRDQTRAITEVVLHSEPLAEQVLQHMLPRLQQDEKDRVAAAGTHFYDVARLTDRVTVLIFLTSGVLGGLLAFSVSRHFTRCIGGLKTGADALGAGNLDHRILLSSRDELGDLADTFNGMAARLREAHDELTHANVELERRHLEQQALMEAAESASLAKTQFLANMSHELRTPMNAIIGYSEMLTEEAEDLGVGKLIPDLNKISGAGKHLLSLVTDLLDLSKVEVGKMEINLEWFDIREMLNDVTATMLPVARKNGNDLVSDIDPALGRMQADPTKVRQALFNLLGNACKFTRNGHVELRATREVLATGPWVRFRVIDSGIGMTPDQARKVFEPFTQADASTSRKYGGTGLGLTISRRFCELMGGSVHVESELGKGTTFTIRLPLNVVPSPREPSAAVIV